MSSQPYVRRIRLNDWAWQANGDLGSLTVYGRQVWWGLVLSWQCYLRDSMIQPQKLGQVAMQNGLFGVWSYRGHLWVSCQRATAQDVQHKGAKIKPRYEVKQQWWWEFSDPSIHGMMESMDRWMLGLKQQHEVTWSSLSKPKKAQTKQSAGTIGVRDNRHIPQWVKIHVVLRDKGRCVYCDESNIKLLEFDHRKAWSKGGSSKDPVNICLGCRPCNRKKSDKDWGWQ